MNRFDLRKELITIGAHDFFHIQNGDYPRSCALNLVGNRYNMDKQEREVLHRGVFGQREALRRYSKKFYGCPTSDTILEIDGYNVHITIESFLLERPVIRANDGVCRDIAGISGNFKLAEVSFYASEMLCNFLDEYRPKKVLLYFDTPISKSGELASFYRKKLNQLGVAGTASAVPVPESQFLYHGTVVASSDSVVMDRADKWIDLPYLIFARMGKAKLFMDFSFLRKIHLTVDLSAL